MAAPRAPRVRWSPSALMHRGGHRVVILPLKHIHTSTPLTSAALSLEPAPRPATRMSVLETEPGTLAPARLDAAVAWARGICSVTAKQIVLP